MAVLQGEAWGKYGLLGSEGKWGLDREGLARQELGCPRQTGTGLSELVQELDLYPV